MNLYFVDNDNKKIGSGLILTPEIKINEIPLQFKNCNMFYDILKNEILKCFKNNEALAYCISHSVGYDCNTRKNYLLLFSDYVSNMTKKSFLQKLKIRDFDLGNFIDGPIIFDKLIEDFLFNAFDGSRLVINKSGTMLFEDDNFYFGFFDCFDEKILKILKNIYRYRDNNNSITKSIWSSYTKSKKIVKYDENGKKYLLPIHYKKYEPASDKIFSTNYNSGNSFYVSEVYNDEDLLYEFLNLLFSSKHSYVIKRCERCKKFFIAKDSRQKNCNRVYKNDKTCIQLNLEKNNNAYEKNIIRKYEKKILNKYSAITETDNRNKFLNEKDLKKATLSGKEYLYWLIKSHYIDEILIKKYLKEIDEYLICHTDFEENFKNKYHKK